MWKIGMVALFVVLGLVQHRVLAQTNDSTLLNKPIKIMKEQGRTHYMVEDKHLSKKTLERLLEKFPLTRY